MEMTILIDGWKFSLRSQFLKYFYLNKFYYFKIIAVFEYIIYNNWVDVCNSKQ